MTIRPATCYSIDCDHLFCYATTAELGEYPSWATATEAVLDWEDLGGVVLADGRSYCEQHKEEYAAEPRVQVARVDQLPLQMPSPFFTPLLFPDDDEI